MMRRAVLLAAALAGPAGAETSWLLTPAQTQALSDDHAAVLFDGLAPVKAVLASKRWHGDFGGWGCTYAIVALAQGAPAPPPSRPPEDDLGWEFAFGGDWRATPMPPPGDTTRDALASCEGEWDAAMAARVRAAADDPGGWWSRDEVGETVSIYSPAHRLAARIRYGD